VEGGSGATKGLLSMAREKQVEVSVEREKALSHVQLTIFR